MFHAIRVTLMVISFDPSRRKSVKFYEVFRWWGHDATYTPDHQHTVGLYMFVCFSISPLQKKSRAFPLLFGEHPKCFQPGGCFRICNCKITQLLTLRSQTSIGRFFATSHDLTPKGSWGREIPIFQGNLGWWNIIIWPEICTEWCVSLQRWVAILPFHDS